MSEHSGEFGGVLAPEHLNLARLTFTVYWQNASPSTEVFYLLDNLPARWQGPTLAGISYLEQQIVELLTSQELVQPLRAVFIASNNVRIHPDEVNAADWRVISPPTD
jgi:hypothetical protein